MSSVPSFTPSFAMGNMGMQQQAPVNRAPAFAPKKPITLSSLGVNTTGGTKSVSLSSKPVSLSAAAAPAATKSAPVVATPAPKPTPAPAPVAAPAPAPVAAPAPAPVDTPAPAPVPENKEELKTSTSESIEESVSAPSSVSIYIIVLTDSLNLIPWRRFLLRKIPVRI